jgi:hemerythrin-like domain-containing protein
MGKATEELIKTHRFVEKILEQFDPKEIRFPEIRSTLERAIVAHAWLQDEIFLPALKNKALIEERFLSEVTQEHQDLEYLLKRLAHTALDAQQGLDALVLQIRTLLDTHFQKEAQALYPLAEKVVDETTLRELGDEMERRKTEVRAAILA